MLNAALALEGRLNAEDAAPDVRRVS
jgi:hypothetical protein